MLQAVFRCDVAPLLALVGLQLLWTGRLSAARGLTVGVVALCGCVMFTAPLDSLLWRRPLWPESEVFWFNVVLNRYRSPGTDCQVAAVIRPCACTFARWPSVSPPAQRWPLQMFSTKPQEGRCAHALRSGAASGV